MCAKPCAPLPENASPIFGRRALVEAVADGIDVCALTASGNRPNVITNARQLSNLAGFSHLQKPKLAKSPVERLVAKYGQKPQAVAGGYVSELSWFQH
jgi:hypothetical protein